MKASPHRQAIVIFGIIIPIVFIGALLGGTFYGKSKIAHIHNDKVAKLERYEAAKVQANQLEATMSADNRREKMEYWNSKLEQDFIQSVTSNLNTILAKFEPDVLTRTEMGQAPGASNIGPKTENPHVRIQLSFEGGYKPMQLLLAELEAEMPQLVLESLSIQPIPSQSERDLGKLRFGVVYLGWEKPKA